VAWIRFRARLVEREAVAERQHLARFRLDAGAPAAAPGQFVQLNLPEAFWPRPFSLLEWDAGSFRILFSEAGCATRALARLSVGAELTGHGPLGRGFPPVSGPTWMIAGGYGVAPLLYCSRRVARGGDVRFFYGAARAGLLWRSAELDRFETTLCTEDGSLGTHGTVLDAVRAALAGPGASAAAAARPTIHACGPMGLLAAVAELARERRLRAFVSVEAPMPCGVGVCRGCAVPMAGPGEGAGEPAPRYAMACEDGPVFEAHLIDWHAEAACRT
jgi:dihydroorotate dehydrogenase electron transfer subunit